MDRGQYDVTHSYGNVVGCDVITAQSCHRAGMDVIKSLPKKSIKSYLNYGIADRVRLSIEHRNYTERRYRKVIAVSGGVRREIMQYYNVPGKDIEVIPNGVDLVEFTPEHREELREAVRGRLGIGADDFVLIFVAHEFDRKGLESIVRALSIPKLKEVKVLVLGGDNKIPYLQLATKLGVEKQVLFLGSVTDISTYYAASDVFVLPTYYEAFSLATLEAAASGLPLLVTKVNGTEELVREGYNGYFVARDGESIAEKLEFILSDSQKLRELGMNARKSAEQYSWDVIADKTLSVYEKIAGTER